MREYLDDLGAMAGVGEGGEAPYSTVAQIKILGVAFDKEFSFRAHLERSLAKAKTILAILPVVSSCSWGLKVGMLRLTGNALIISLLRYGLAVTGSGLEGRRTKQFNTRIVNVLGGQVLGVAQSARIPVLHDTAEVTSMRNLYIQHCAEMLNLTLRAARSSI